MKLINIKTPNQVVSLKEAIFNPIGSDNGLYLPTYLNKLDRLFINTLKNYTLQEIAELVLGHLLHEDIDNKSLKNIVENAFNFPCPLVELNENISILELFHGPTLAFKDFGARFMSRLMSYFINDEKEINIIVATSGDTGGAVASGFLDVDNIVVHILYPKGKVSKLQRKQLTTNGSNINAIEIDGTFDDCQDMVKKCFTDNDLKFLNLTTANSINIARLLPQMVYYFQAYKLMKADEINVCVPSGNFGNITAGIMAKRIGLPINKLIAAHNANKPVVDYINSGEYNPYKAITTLSNAMDIGNPSNFPRALNLSGSTWNNFNNLISAYSFNDKQTIDCIKDVYQKFQYVLDPHTSIGYLATEQYQKEFNDKIPICLLSTAHPCKFSDEITPLTEIEIKMPSSINVISNKEEKYISMKNKYKDLKTYLMNK